MTEELKKGWTKVAFGDVVRLVKERSSNPEADGFERYVGLEHLDPGELKIRRWGDILDGTTFTSVFRAGQVLFGKRRAYQRKLAVADFDGICSGDIYIFESKNSQLLPELLPYICQTDMFFEHAIGTSAGSLSPRTNWKSMGEYEFALPPMEEQRRLAKVLSKKLVFEDKLTELKKCSIYLKRTISEHLCWNSDFPKKAIVEIADPSIGSFYDGDWIETKDQSTKGIRLIQLADIGQGIFLNKSTRYITKETFLRLKCKEVEPGDLLISRMADPIGRSCIVPNLGEKLIAAVDCCIVKLDKIIQNPLYWNYALNTYSWTRLVKSSAAGSTRLRISRANLEKLKVPMPELEIQNHIVERLRLINIAEYKIESFSSIIPNMSKLSSN